MLKRIFACLDILPYRHLILHKAWADFRADVSRTYLGVAWWVVDPLVQTGIYYLVFGIIMRSRVQKFVPFLLIGIVFYRWFSAAVGAGAGSIFANMAFVRQVAFHKLVFPFTNILSQSIHMVFSLGVLFVILRYYGFHIQIHYAALPVILLVQLLFIAGVSLPLCAIVPFVPDLKNVVAYVLRLGFFMSGVQYDGHDPHIPMQELFWLNPMAILIDESRQVLMYGAWPNWRNLMFISIVSLIGIYIGAWLILRFGKVYAKRVVS